MTHQGPSTQHLPACVVEYINHVIRRMRYSRSARREVKQELLDHFTDALADYPDPQQRQTLAEQLIAEFGDVKLLATLLRRAKKRNRPAWLKALIRTGQAFLLLLALFILYTAWFVTGRPTISTNYVAVLSKRMQPKAPETENAWPLYRQAVLAFVLPPAYVAAPATQPGNSSPVFFNVLYYIDTDLLHAPAFVQTALRECVASNERAWQEYVAASHRPYSWYDISAMDALHREIAQAEAARRGETLPPIPDTAPPEQEAWKGSVMASMLPDLARIRSLAKLGILKARLDATAGNAREAMEDLLTIARVARHWQNPDGYIISQLVGTAITNLACEEIRRLAGERALTPKDLRQAQEQLAALYPGGYPLFGVEAERIGLIDMVQRAFTQGGPGGGHLVPEQVLSLMRFMRSTGMPAEPTIGDTGIAAASTLFHAGRDDTLAMGNAYYDRVVEWSKLTPYQQKGQPNPDRMVERMMVEHRLRYQILCMTLPSLVRVSELIRQARCEYEAALAVLALQRYQLDKGQYPPSLEALIEASYLPSVPADPYSAGPLVYRRTGEAFTLYSVGGNFQDDGALHNPDDPWSSYGSSKPGDRVFWPVPALKSFPQEEEPVQGVLSR